MASKRKTQGAEPAEKKHKPESMGPPAPREPRASPETERKNREQKLAEGETKEVWPGVKVHKLLHQLNMASGQARAEEGRTTWNMLCEEPEGRALLFRVYRALWEEHVGFVGAVKDYSKSARLSLEDVDGQYDEEIEELDSGLAFVQDIEKVADEIDHDVYQAQVLAAVGSN